MHDLRPIAFSALEVRGDEALAFEDSKNGIQAAKAAGIICVAVPTAMTAGMDLSQADLRLSSLEEMPLADLIRRTSSGRSRPPAPGRPGAPISD
jgi:putative hydrolase of the HAD superfamily